MHTTQLGSYSKRPRVRGPKPVTHHDWTPMFGGCVIRFESKNGPMFVFGRDWIMCLNYTSYFRFNQHNWGGPT